MPALRTRRLIVSAMVALGSAALTVVPAAAAQPDRAQQSTLLFSGATGCEAVDPGPCVSTGLVDYDYEMRRAENLGLTGPAGSSRKMFLRARANSIEGGTSEIQRNILGERVLGLPGDLRADTMPWKEIPRG